MTMTYEQKAIQHINAGRISQDNLVQPVYILQTVERI